MASQPPETPFYNDTENAALWQDIASLYEGYLGRHSEHWSQREEMFVTVINDVHARLRDGVRRPQL
jgi:hypothetical protein